MVAVTMDSNIVNIALPSIKSSLGFSDTSLVWAVDAYLVTYAGLRLIGGRLGDLFGHRKIFLQGTILFTLASIVCSLANSPTVLILGRAAQGLGGSLIASTSISLILTLFLEPGSRARALGVYGFACSSGALVGLLLGGALTGALNWHWIFGVNLPIGVLIWVSGYRLLPHPASRAATGPLDVAGASILTIASVVTVYAIVNGDKAGWNSIRTLGLLCCAAVLFILLATVELQAAEPIVPSNVFRTRNLPICMVIGMLLFVASSAAVLVSLYLQLVLQYGPLKAGFTFLPATVVTAIFSVGISARLVERFGVKRPLLIGIWIAGLGLALLTRTRVNGSVLVDTIPGTTFLYVGVAMAFNPLILAATKSVAPTEIGLVSGIIGTTSIMGSALGLSILASAAATRTSHLSALGLAPAAALNSGYHLAFSVALASAIGAAVLATVLLRAEPAIEEQLPDKLTPESVNSLLP